MGKLVERCAKCGRPVRSLTIDSDTGETVLVSGSAVFVAIQIPDLADYTTAYANRVHRCPRRARRERGEG